MNSDLLVIVWRRICFVCAVSLVLLTADLSHGEHWPQFRGVNGDGITESSFPEDWDSEKNVRWKLPTEGEGWSCPITWGDQVFFTAAVPTGDANANGLSYREGGRGADLG